MRYLRLFAGVVVSAIGVVLMLQARIGLEPWSILHQGIGRQTGIAFGTVSILVGAAAVILALFMGERFGMGTILNTVLCGLIIDGLIALQIIPEMRTLPGGLLMLLAGMECLALGTWLYMKAALGAGPRDALMVALAKRLRISVGVCRIGMETLCTVLGFIMGGQIGIGTAVVALGFGLLLNLNFKWLRFDAAAIQHEDIRFTFQKLKRPH